jgi:hypothetical protein
LSNSDLNAAHTLDAADQCERPPTAREHSGRFKYADHARAALHDGREGRHVRIEFGFEPRLARQIGVGQIGDHRAPDAKIDWAAHSFCHGLHDRHGQGQ